MSPESKYTRAGVLSDYVEQLRKTPYYALCLEIFRTITEEVEFVLYIVHLTFGNGNQCKHKLCTLISEDRQIRWKNHRRLMQSKAKVHTQKTCLNSRVPPSDSHIDRIVAVRYPRPPLCKGGLF